MAELAGQIEFIAANGQDLPLYVPLDTEVEVRVGWRNASPVNAEGHVDLTITPPLGDSYSVAARSGQDTGVPPGGGYSVVFYPFLVASEGDYQAEVTLSLEET